MHQLEREAQDDPFLMDALEGYAVKDADQQEQLSLLQNRLQQRINQQKVRRMTARWLMAAAASVLVILTITYLFWPAGKQSNINAPVATLTPKTASPNSQPAISKKPVAPQLAAKPSAAAITRSSRQLSEAAPVPAASPMTANATPIAAAMARAADTVAQKAAISMAKRADSTNTAALLAADKKESPAMANAPVPAVAKARTMAAMVAPHTKINGMVSDETGHLLSGVAVVEKGKNEVAKTDSKGRFSIPANDGDILVFTNPGFKSQEIKGTVNDSLNVILEAESKSLSEMVAIDFGRLAPSVKEAHPQVGWDNYNQYLKNGAFVTQGKSGTVRLSFTVEANSQLSNFKVVKSLSAEADQIAVHLVKDGPAWVPDVSGKAKTVNLKVVFTLQQKQ
jgi:TonB family protein